MHATIDSGNGLSPFRRQASAEIIIPQEQTSLNC